MGNINLKNVSKSYSGGIEALKGINLNIYQGEFVVILGPNGSGKSTLIRLVAGLETPTNGKVYINNTNANEISPNERNVAVIYQNSALYPQMTVYENLSFVLKLNRVDFKSIEKKVSDTAILLGIKDLLECRPEQLNQVQKQKVILGRAVVKDPDIILIDESATDEDKYEGINLIEEMMQIHEKTNKTVVYAMHNIEKALKEVDAKIVIIKDGILQQVGFRKDIYNQPNNVFVASLLENYKESFKTGEIMETKDYRMLLNIGKKRYLLPNDIKEYIEIEKGINKEVIVAFGSRELLIYDKETESFLFRYNYK